MSDPAYHQAMVQLRQEIAHVCYDSTEIYDLLMGLELVVDRGWWTGREDVLEAVEKCATAYARITDDGYSSLVMDIGLKETQHALKPSIDQLLSRLETLPRTGRWREAAETLPEWMTTPMEIPEEEQTIRVEITKKEYEQVLENRRTEENA